MLTRPIAILALALCVALISDSVESKRRPRQQPIGAQNQQSTQPAAPDQRGTDQVPLTVKIQPAPDAKEKANKEDHERQEKAKIDEKLAFETQRIADYTDRLALFTIFLFCAAVAQAGLFVWQLWLILKSLKDAKIASDAATVAARAAKRSAIASVIQAKISRDTLVKIQRPYIFVFDVSRLQTSNDVPFLTPYIEYSVANYGQTPAIIENVGVQFMEGGQPLAPIKVDDDHDLFVSPVLPPGDRRRQLRERLPEPFIGEDLGIIVDLTKNTTHPIPRISPHADLFFRVIAYYRGPFSDGHKTSATWIFDKSLGHFVQYGGREYNYSE